MQNMSRPESPPSAKHSQNLLPLIVSEWRKRAVERQRSSSTSSRATKAANLRVVSFRANVSMLSETALDGLFRPTMLMANLAAFTTSLFDASNSRIKSVSGPQRPSSLGSRFTLSNVMSSDILRRGPNSHRGIPSPDRLNSSSLLVTAANLSGECGSASVTRTEDSGANRDLSNLARCTESVTG